MTDKPLTFKGVPVVFDKPLEPNETRAYVVAAEVGEAMRKAGYDVQMVKLQKPAS